MITSLFYTFVCTNHDWSLISGQLWHMHCRIVLCYKGTQKDDSIALLF